MSDETKIITVTTSDKKSITLDSYVAKMSLVIKNMIEDIGEDNHEIMLPNVSSKILAILTNYCQHVSLHPRTDDEQYKMKRSAFNDYIPDWEKFFIENLDFNTLIETISAADYLDINNLIDIGCRCIANMIRGKTPNEICEIFGVKGGPESFSEKEKEDVYMEFPWTQPKVASDE